jgi:Transglycosylase SLT domain
MEPMRESHLDEDQRVERDRSKLVRLLYFGGSGMRRHRSGAAAHWRNGADFTLVCDCQHHARRERTLWRRSLRAINRTTRRLGRGGIALLVGVPLAFGAMGIPTEAMNLSLLTSAAVVTRPIMEPLPIFTTKGMKNDFLASDQRPQIFSLAVVKEDFFRTEVPYGPIIYREAIKNRLSPELVAAVVESESDFRAHLVSEKDARGLMQIIPSTGRLMGAEDLFNPADNIAAGTRYLRYLVDRFGDQRIALAAYNAGEGNVERFGGVPPFQETVNYVQRVNMRTHLYRQRIRGNYLASARMQPTFAR